MAVKTETRKKIEINRQEQEAVQPGTKIMYLLLISVPALLLVSIYAQRRASDYGMPESDLRRELLPPLLYFISASVAFVSTPNIVGLGKIVFRILVAMLAWILITNQMNTSLALAPIKQEFAAASEQCYIAEPNKLDCDGKLDALILKRDRTLDRLGVAMVGEWKVTAPNTEDRKTSLDALYFRKLF